MQVTHFYLWVFCPITANDIRKWKSLRLTSDSQLSKQALSDSWKNSFKQNVRFLYKRIRIDLAQVNLLRSISPWPRLHHTQMHQWRTTEEGCALQSVDASVIWRIWAALALSATSSPKAKQHPLVDFPTPSENIGNYGTAWTQLVFSFCDRHFVYPNGDPSTRKCCSFYKWTGLIVIANLRVNFNGNRFSICGILFIFSIIRFVRVISPALFASVWPLC